MCPHRFEADDVPTACPPVVSARFVYLLYLREGWLLSFFGSVALEVRMASERENFKI